MGTSEDDDEAIESEEEELAPLPDLQALVRETDTLNSTTLKTRQTQMSQFSLITRL